MKKSILTLILTAFAYFSFAQDISGSWNGSIEYLGSNLTIVFNIQKTDSAYISTMDSPDQGIYGIKVDSTSFENSILKIKSIALGFKYNGMLTKTGTIDGTYLEMSQSFPLTLTKGKANKKEIVRFQEPQQPYPYYTEEVEFENAKDNVTLAGTLTLPQKTGKYPIVILISGSGPQNRDEEILGHKPFLVLADHLTRQGIGVLRYDDRGVYQSTGDFPSSTSADFSTDVESAVKYLKKRKEVNKKQIGLIGHSEGGLIAPMVAARSKDINYIVLMAGPGMPGDELMIHREELILKKTGLDEHSISESIKQRKEIYDAIIKANDLKSLEITLTRIYNKRFEISPEPLPEGMTKEDYIASKAKIWANPWMSYFIKYDPSENLKKVKCPVLAVNGEKDVQVPSEKNLKEIKTHIESGGNYKVTVEEFPNLNHLFQNCETGFPDEYSQIEETFSPIALDKISTWILSKINQNK
ncbi:alpha/beta hydrolase family protein [Aureibacter tunicatorum]|uniref:Xaa-Pro dipeptidyl-peptidase-like domain-containing protein n=1 Tax=Aureibacter tunicatorum TaxID=866807 RepID=A0AAE4BPZ7_9BACT|nr:alpha/beta fold hydrolase [Aureibacter tunicatorum]MDR6238539.1 hypothetical protein [Aureibacter tunicatorum]BDD05530.1 alpha/beta hydrolase [Aureibacter tunicatorum]